MGANAQRRRAAKAATKPVKPTTDELIAKRMRQMQTLAQFEQTIASAPPELRGSLRKKLEPFLPEGLPCCGPGKLAAVLIAKGREVNEDFGHSEYCPTYNRVELVSSAPPVALLSRRGGKVARILDAHGQDARQTLEERGEGAGDL